MNFLIIFYQIVLVLLAAPLAAGLVKFFKARLQGRKGASPFLPYITLLTLFKKQMVISNTASWVFRVCPYIILGTMLYLVFALPLTTLSFSFNSGFINASDFVVFAGVLMLGTIFLVMGGLESSSAFGGMGSSREMTIAALLEPTIILIFAAFAITTQSSSITSMVSQLNYASHPFTMLSFIALLMVALAENARYPVDNPATHLELTMVHEAMILEYSGPYLAMIEYASFIKLTIFSLLLSNFFWPVGMITLSSGIAAFLLAPLFMLIKIVVTMFLLALLESTIVKMRFYRVQEFLTIGFFFALGGVLLTLISTTL